MGVTCNIQLNKSREGVYYTGQTVSGIVKYAIDKPTEYQAITLSLLGKGKCNWTESNSDGDTTYYQGSQDLITIHTALQSRQIFTLQAGSYEAPFQYQLPENMPSSFKNPTCTIRYRVQIIFLKNNFFGTKKKFHIEIPVYELLQPSTQEPVSFSLNKSIFKLFSSKTHLIELRGTSPSLVSPGESVKLNLYVHNNTDEEPMIVVELFCSTTLKSKNGTDKRCKKIEGCCIKTREIQKRSAVNVELAVPTKADLYTINCKIMQKEYFFKVTLNLPAPRTNAVVKVPILIGERKSIGSVSVVREAPFWELMLEDVETE